MSDYVEAREELGTLFLVISLPFPYTDETPDDLKAMLSEVLPDHFWDVVEDMSFDQGEDTQEVEVTLGTTDTDMIRALIDKIDVAVSDMVSAANAG